MLKVGIIFISINFFFHIYQLNMYKNLHRNLKVRNNMCKYYFYINIVISQEL